MTAVTAPRFKIDLPQAVMAGFVLLILGILLALFLWIGPAAERADASAAKKQKIENAQTNAALHHLGFAGITVDSLIDDQYYGTTYFFYKTGACNLQVFVDGIGSSTSTYVPLKGVPNGTLSVTAARLKKLPQTQACFIK